MSVKVQLAYPRPDTQEIILHVNAEAVFRFAVEENPLEFAKQLREAAGIVESVILGDVEEVLSDD